jgi:hypothetical protein
LSAWFPGWRRRRHFEAHTVRDVHVVATDRKQPFWRRRSAPFWPPFQGRIAFNYGKKSIRFGENIDEAEAKQIVAAIQRRFPQYRTTEVTA